MKKFLTLALVLVLALAMTIPAMAFTDKAKTDATDYEVDVYLVEYEDDEFFGLTGMPPSDRGYAKNEIVAAIAELNLPEDSGDLDTDDYSGMVFDGDSVSFLLTENTADRMASNNVVGKGTWSTATAKEFSFDFTANGTLDEDDTYKFLFFAKVTGDDASITATLTAKGEGFISGSMDWEDYTITRTGDNYTVSEGAVQLFTIKTDDGESEGLVIYLPATTFDAYTVIDRSTGIGFVGPDGLVDEDDDKAIYRDLMDIYEEIFVDEFGFDFDKIGGIVDEDTFEALAGTDNVEATVEIKPWTAYVTVPDNIVVDPPKTGDAASIVGFVMIVLAAAAVVAVKKVRA